MVLKLDVLNLYHQRKFENDVKMYGTQTGPGCKDVSLMFENDVKMYGTQTALIIVTMYASLRMM